MLQSRVPQEQVVRVQQGVGYGVVNEEGKAAPPLSEDQAVCPGEQESSQGKGVEWRMQ